MSEMVERVGKALLQMGYAPVTKEQFETAARVVIAAMREPTEAMIDAGRAAWLDSASDYNRVDASNLAAFTAMIDAALGDER